MRDVRDIKLVNVHDEATCESRVCVIHSPTDHHMRDWTVIWRGDRGIFERICEHGIGHPDPDQFPYWRETGQGWLAVHGCCGTCCNERRFKGMNR
jgi:hypothetical protein